MQSRDVDLCQILEVLVTGCHLVTQPLPCTHFQSDSVSEGPVASKVGAVGAGAVAHSFYPVLSGKFPSTRKTA